MACGCACSGGSRRSRARNGQRTQRIYTSKGCARAGVRGTEAWSTPGVESSVWERSGPSFRVALAPSGCTAAGCVLASTTRYPRGTRVGYRSRQRGGAKRTGRTTSRTGSMGIITVGAFGPSVAPACGTAGSVLASPLQYPRGYCRVLHPYCVGANRMGGRRGGERGRCLGFGGARVRLRLRRRVGAVGRFVFQLWHAAGVTASTPSTPGGTTTTAPTRSRGEAGISPRFSPPPSVRKASDTVARPPWTCPSAAAASACTDLCKTLSTIYEAAYLFRVT